MSLTGVEELILFCPPIEMCTVFNLSSFSQDYGRTFGKGDVLGCFADLESEPIVLSFTVNGQHQGIAYEIYHSELGDQALFPHIVTKNCSFKVSIGFIQIFFFFLLNTLYGKEL